ncbi:MAG: ATP-binding cassette domain-containing protein, partial [Tabrizicola sp.]
VYDLLGRLKAEGVTVLFISHRMNEVEALCDRLSVFRNGRHIETFARGERTDAEIVRLMIGRDVTAKYPPKPAPMARPPVLRVQGLEWEGVLKGVSLTLGKGEILGVGGLDGQGQKELLLALFGVLKGVRGRVDMGGRGLPSSPIAARSGRPRVALIPEDRKTEGLMLPLPIADNLVAAGFERISRSGVIDPARLEAAVQDGIARLQIKVGSPSDPVRTLSGGNQQKVVIAKWLMTDPDIILMNDPTRGIDVGTKQEIFRMMRDLADSGRSILFHSSDYAELIGCADRVLVLHDGRVVRELEGAAISEEAIVRASLNIGTAA